MPSRAGTHSSATTPARKGPGKRESTRAGFVRIRPLDAVTSELKRVRSRERSLRHRLACTTAASELQAATARWATGPGP